ncbi:fibronectin type III domain-containing protein [Dactylosporangium sp. CA-092794]|uniref:fibronectin type III domain-containing protein n=1 Tax=Dactylosporangium sp. CA-092794 TaxID=3239929 RepID=UPI003D8D9A43
MNATHAGPARARRLGRYVTAGTVFMVLAAAVTSFFGLGASDKAVAGYMPAAWLFSRQVGELGRVNGLTAKVDTRVRLDGTAGHQIEVSNTDSRLVFRDVETGTVYALDLITLQISASLQTTPGEGVQVLVNGEVAYIVDRIHGEVRQVNAAALAPVGPAVELPPGLRGGEFDTDGRLWLAVPSEGTLVAVSPAAKQDAQPAVKPTPVAQPNHDLAVSVLDKGAAVLDRTASKLITVDGTKVTNTAALTLPGPATLAPRTTGDQVPVTVAGSRKVIVVGADGVAHTFSVPGGGGDLGAAVAWAGWFYVADNKSGEVFVLDGEGALVGDPIRFPGRTAIELQVRGDRLYINAVDGSTAVVVDTQHKVSAVADKYPVDVTGAQPTPPAPSAPPSSAPASSTPPVHRPSVPAPRQSSLPPPVRPSSASPAPSASSAPATQPPPTEQPTATTSAPSASAQPPGGPPTVTATGGDGTAHLSWAAAPANGSPITAYAIVDSKGNPLQDTAGRPVTVAGNLHTYDVTGLTNGTSYTFGVYAVNAQGNGPVTRSQPVVPTAEATNPPSGVTATAQKDGTVTVTWAAPNAQGDSTVTAYQISATGPDGPAGTWSAPAATTTFTVPSGALAYGTQVAFSVAAVDAKGATSKPSALSASVTPYTAPAAPGNLRVTTAKTAGVVNVAWDASAGNGRPVAQYRVVYNGTAVDVRGGTTYQITGLTGGASVTVTVTAVNDAGDAGPAAGPVVAKAMGAPKLTLTSQEQGYTWVRANFTADAGGGTVRCGLTLTGRPAVEGSCNSITVGGLRPGTRYTGTLTVTNEAGHADKAVTFLTKVLRGTVHCVSTNGYCDSGIGIYSAPKQDTGAETNLSGTNGQQYEAFCRVHGQAGNQAKNPVLTAGPYNPGKQPSDWWIRIAAVPNDTAPHYIPWVWLNLDAGDDLNNLPSC